METKNIGFIGFGFIGKVHAYGYINLPMYYEGLPFQPVLSHVCTSRQETAEAGARMIGAPHAVTDYREITANPAIDIVHICTPNHLHKEALLSAMASGKHIYCDKPLTATMAQAEAVAAALPDYRGTAQMTLQNRFFPATMRAKQLIDEGFLGKVLEYRCCYLHAGSAQPQAPLRWKLSSEAGGGVISDLASHILDLMHFLLGDYARLTAATSIAYPERPCPEQPKRMLPVKAEDCVMILTRMASGALGHIEATKIATGSEDEIRFEIHGSSGALRFNGMDPHHLEVWNEGASASPGGGTRGWTRVDCGQRYPAPATGFPTPKAAIGWMRCHMACLANFLFDIAAGNPGNPGLSQGLYLQHLMDCCRRADRSGTWITVEN
ncbi:MAG: Gfo/Idh/MocA family oxidoreductase [Pirellulales bacterium]|nr:Gfo/Idh/MocA family oxidoreductase [Pirellulales bacterium]